MAELRTVGDGFKLRLPIARKALAIQSAEALPVHGRTFNSSGDNALGYLATGVLAFKPIGVARTAEGVSTLVPLPLLLLDLMKPEMAALLASSVVTVALEMMLFSSFSNPKVSHSVDRK